MERINLAEDRDKCWAVVHTVTNLYGSIKRVNFLDWLTSDCILLHAISYDRNSALRV